MLFVIYSIQILVMHWILHLIRIYKL